jgi:hypothetical protein
MGESAPNVEDGDELGRVRSLAMVFSLQGQALTVLGAELEAEIRRTVEGGVTADAVAVESGFTMKVTKRVLDGESLISVVLGETPNSGR